MSNNNNNNNPGAKGNDAGATSPGTKAENKQSTITDDELKLLDLASDDEEGGDDEALRKAELDNKDDDGDLLNEEGSADDVSGDDLDVPGADADDADEEIGEEDEENNGYSGAREQND